MNYVKWELLFMYQETAKGYLETVKYVLSPVDPQLHFILGYIGELGELFDAIKKHKIYGQDLDKENVLEELGDLLYYVALYFINNKIEEDFVLYLNELLSSNIELFFNEDELSNSRVGRALLDLAKPICKCEELNVLEALVNIGTLAHILIDKRMGDVMQYNIDKLSKRYPDGYSEAMASGRLDKR